MELQHVMEYGIDCGRAGMGNGTAAVLARIAARLHRLYEHSCNVGVSDGQERSIDTLQARAAMLAKSAGVDLEHQTAPRGWPIILRHNGREWRVPPVRIGTRESVYEDFVIQSASERAP